MLTSFKINTAIFICIAFILRLLVVNIGSISSLDGPHKNGFTKSHFSSKMKRRKNVEASSVSTSNTSGTTEYLAAEICEEDSNENTPTKSNSFFLVQVLYSLIADKLVSDLKRILPFYKHFSYTESHRYLTYQVFRI